MEEVELMLYVIAVALGLAGAILFIAKKYEASAIVYAFCSGVWAAIVLFLTLAK